jgi:hypothetical protein
LGDAPPSRPPERPLRAGEEVAGRYVIVSLIASAEFAAHYRVKDKTNEALFSLWSTRGEEPGLSEAMALAPLLQKLDHRNIARTVAVGRDGERLHVITEPIEGESLKEHLARRGTTQGFPFRSAVNVVLQLASAIHAAHALAPHGALGLEAVWVLSSGRLKIAPFGLGIATSSAGLDELRAKDVRELCLLLYHLLTGGPWVPGAPPAGQIRSQIPAGIDALLQGGLEGQRIEVSEFYHALAAAAGAKPLAPDTAPPSAPAAPSVAEDSRWMVVRGHLDYGPFSVDQLRREMAEGRLTPESFLKSLSTGARRVLRELPELRFLLVEHEKRVAAAKVKAEEDRKLLARRRRRLLRASLNISVVLAISAGVVFFFVWRMQTPEIVRAVPPIAPEPVKRAEVKVSVPPVLIKRSEANEGTKKGRRKRRGSPSGGVAFAPSSPGGETRSELPSLMYEAPPPTTEVDFSKSGGTPGSGTSRQAVKDMVRQSSQRLRPCFDQELRRTPDLRGRYTVSFSVASSGRGYGVRVTGEGATSGLEGCVRAILVGIAFPRFSGMPLHVEYPINISDD